MIESEKACLLGLNSSNNNDNAVEAEPQSAPLAKMQTFLTNMHDNCYHMLGSICTTIGRDFYHLPGLATALLNSVFSNMEVGWSTIEITWTS